MAESAAEIVKRQSDFLRGTISEVLARPEPRFEDGDETLLKFHGIYQQDDRDVRNALKGIGANREYSFMVRTKIPGGILSARQYLVLDGLASRFAMQQAMRVTTRQGIQFHGILKDRLVSTIAEINHTLISTLAACGDVSRNVMACPAPYRGGVHDQVREIARAISDHLMPRSTAYHEIWLDGEKVPTRESEPLYGETYLPRKFKIGIAFPEENSVDIGSQDLGFVALVKDGRLTGFNLLVGGGMGMTLAKKETYARLATPLARIAPEHAIAAAEAVVKVHRDFGDRANRKHARLKYVVEEFGIERVREVFAERFPHPFDLPVGIGPLGFDDYLGTREQGDGKYFHGLFIENGRINDTPGRRIKTALRLIAGQFEPEFILTPNQSVIFAGLDPGVPEKIERIFRETGVPALPSVSAARRFSMACVALPTCGLALAEAERALPAVIDELERTLAGLGLADAPLATRMTGCPNGCARPYTADIAFVGRKPEHYDIFVGGRLTGDRLADPFAESVAVDALIETLRPLLAQWAGGREGHEGLGDFYQRTRGSGQHRTLLTGAKESFKRNPVEA